MTSGKGEIRYLTPRALARGMYTSVTGNAQAFGFSVTVTVVFKVLSSAVGPASQVQMVVFALAAVAAFSTLNVALTALVDTDQARSEPQRVVLLSTATDFLAVGAGVGSALGWVRVLDGWAAWIVVPFSAGLVYVAVQGLELVAGEREQKKKQEQ